MAMCPKCHSSGANWKYCEACGRFFCGNCARKEMDWRTSNKCPFCGVLNKVKTKAPK